MFQSTSIMFLTASFMLNHLLAVPLSLDLQCMEVNNPNNVAFETLRAYKANRISFDPMKSDYAGNYVEIIENLPTLNSSMFVTYESNYIIKLALSKREIRHVAAGAFIGLDCLHYLRLRSNKIGAIVAEMFLGLDNLLELSLENNRIADIPTDVFKHLTSLQTLDLSNNKLSSIDSSPFKHVPTLVNLDLSYNNLDSLPNGAFSELKHLFKLDLSYNKLHGVPVDSWEHLDTLKSFILTGNILAEFNLDSIYEYKSLVYLYLDSNRFKQFELQHIKLRFPKLLLLELQDNPWNCDDLYGVIKMLNETRMQYHHKNSTGTNVNGLDCIDYSISTTSTSERPHSTSTDSGSNDSDSNDSNSNDSDSSSTTTDSPIECGECATVKIDNGDLVVAIQSVKSIALCILVLILLLGLFDCLVRGGIIDKFSRSLGCRDYRMFDQENAEHIRLLNTRSRL